MVVFNTSLPLIGPLTSLDSYRNFEGESNIERELDLSAFVYEPNESDVAQSEDVGGHEWHRKFNCHTLLHHLDRNRWLFRWVLGFLKMLAEV